MPNVTVYYKIYQTSGHHRQPRNTTRGMSLNLGRQVRQLAAKSVLESIQATTPSIEEQTGEE